MKTKMTAIVTAMMVMGNVMSDSDGGNSNTSGGDDHGSDSDGDDRDGDDGSDRDSDDMDGNDPYLIKMLLMSDNVEITFFGVVVISQCVYTECAHYSTFGTGNRSYK